MTITKRMLQDYRKNKREIPVLRLELEEMLTTPTGLGTVMDYKTGYPRAQTIVGIDESRYTKRRDILRRKESEVMAVEEWIEAIADGQARYVFRAFYVNGMSWGRIAKKIGYKGNPDYVRIKIRDKYLLDHHIK